MKPYLACAVLSCLLLPARSQEAGKPSAADILARVRPSVVKLNVVDARKQKSSGSGVFLTANGQILTCYHVIANAKTVVARLANGSTAKVTGVVAFSAAQDWAVVQSDARNAVPAPRGKPSALRQGDRIYTLGAPLGLDLTASDGMVSSIRSIEGVGLYLQITAPISPGSSGGPVLNTDGEVVGIAAFRLREGENLNFAVAISSVEAEWTGTETPRGFAASADSRGKPPAKAPPPDSAEVAHLYAQGASALPGEDASESAKVTACRKALGFLEKANRLIPNDPDIVSGMAYCHGILGDVAKAIGELRTVIRLKPDDAIAHYNLGTALCKLGKSADAIPELRKAIRIKPDLAEAHVNLGTALGNAGHTNGAITEFRSAIRLKPNFAEAHNYLGNAFSDVGRIDDAISEYRVAINCRPDYADAHYDLGVALGKAGKPDDAVSEYRTVIRTKPDLAQAHYNLAAALSGAAARNEAIDEYRTVIHMKPNDAEAHYNLGVELGWTGRTTEETAEYRTAIRIKPDLAEAHGGLGRVLELSGQTDNAIAEFRSAIRLKPDYAYGHFGLGVAFVLFKGDRASALKEYAVLKSLDAALANKLLDLINTPEKKAASGG